MTGISAEATRRERAKMAVETGQPIGRKTSRQIEAQMPGANEKNRQR